MCLSMCASWSYRSILSSSSNFSTEDLLYIFEVMMNVFQQAFITPALLDLFEDFFSVFGVRGPDVIVNDLCAVTPGKVEIIAVADMFDARGAMWHFFNAFAVRPAGAGFDCGCVAFGIKSFFRNGERGKAPTESVEYQYTSS